MIILKVSMFCNFLKIFFSEFFKIKSIIFMASINYLQPFIKNSTSTLARTFSVLNEVGVSTEHQQTLVATPASGGEGRIKNKSTKIQVKY